MKIIYSISLVFICFNVKATDYFVSNSGNDLNNGTSKTTAWKTIKKVNATLFLPGDHILFKAGDVWNEKLNVPSSGTPGHVIIFKSYGTGPKPIITALQPQSGFTNVGNIWTTTVTNGASNLNTVLINGSIRAKGRYPNTGYLTLTSYNDKTQITGSLPGSPDYTGAEAVVRSTHWTLEIEKISSQSKGTLNFSNALIYVPKYGGNGYFIQNSPSVLDTLYEWAYDATSKILRVYSKTSPMVRVSTIDTLIYLSNKEYVTFDGLSFQGANKAAIQLKSTNNIIIQNCSFNYSGSYAINGFLSSHVSVINDSIQNSLCDAIYLQTYNYSKPGCEYALIENNYIKNSGFMPGMAVGEFNQYIGVCVSGAHTTIINNRIDSTGYHAIMFNGPRSLVKNNYISNFCFIKDDGGGIYTVIGSNSPKNIDSESIIRSNIIMNGIGAVAGTLPSTTSPAAGIYLDEGSRYITVDSNTITNCYTSGISLHDISSIKVHENTIYNDIGAGLAIYGNDELISNLDIKRNTIVSQNAKQPNFLRIFGSSIGVTDSNYYYKPSADNISLAGTSYKLSDWSAKTGQDTHSVSVPEQSTTTKPSFYYNPKNINKTYSLNGTYVDIKGRTYKNSITLHSFSSAILFKKD